MLPADLPTNHTRLATQLGVFHLVDLPAGAVEAATQARRCTHPNGTAPLCFSLVNQQPSGTFPAALALWPPCCSCLQLLRLWERRGRTWFIPQSWRRVVGPLHGCGPPARPRPDQATSTAKPMRRVSWPHLPMQAGSDVADAQAASAKVSIAGQRVQGSPASALAWPKEWRSILTGLRQSQKNGGLF